ncbi:hypothetical protein BLNAU_23737 [Blattamonas nauphoetae]|uniref:Uncharacterized protein n=1 Tax=Blattamonas nauphoetae TaxID=2049346 RepID=A0ABQ9WPD0_9EUKA|nr:hypothetical protein BLNAU_23737 [Blattamonas nauphoetae]
MTGKSGKGTMNCKWTSYFCAMLGQQRHPLLPSQTPSDRLIHLHPQPDPHFIFTSEYTPFNTESEQEEAIEVHTMDEEKKDLSKMTDMEHCSIDSAIKDDIDLLTRLSSAEIEQLRLMSTITAQADEHRDFVADNSDSFSGLFTGGEPEHDVFTLSSMVASVSQDSTVCVFDLTTFTVLFIIPPRYPLRPSVHFSIISLEWNALAHVLVDSHSTVPDSPLPIPPTDFGAH